MNIQWKNIFGILALAGIVYLLAHARSILEELQFRVCWPQDPVWQFFMLALLCLTVIAIVTILKR